MLSNGDFSCSGAKEQADRAKLSASVAQNDSNTTLLSWLFPTAFPVPAIFDIYINRSFLFLSVLRPNPKVLGTKPCLCHLY